MKIVFLKSYACRWQDRNLGFAPGVEYDSVPAEVAYDVIKHGIAREVEKEKPKQAKRPLKK